MEEHVRQLGRRRVPSHRRVLNQPESMVVLFGTTRARTVARGFAKASAVTRGTSRIFSRVSCVHLEHLECR